MTPWPLQQAIYSRLDGYSALSALVTAVYDHVHQDAAFPYVVIGEFTAIPFDTHGETGSETTVTIHTWSEYRGKKETHEIQREVYKALHRHALAVSAVETVACEWEFSESFMDDDGLRRHGVQRFRIILDEGA